MSRLEVQLPDVKPLLKGIRSLLRTIIPRRVLAEREIYLRLSPEARRIYLRLRLHDSIGLRATEAHVSAPPRSILFVCFGNIMRSPMAAALLQRELASCGLHDQVGVSSAGLHTLAGRQAHPWAVIAAHELGISLANHRAKPLTREMIHEADAIFAMDFQNKAELLTLYPEASAKFFLLTRYADPPLRGREIPDPYYSGENATRSCYAILQNCVRNLVHELISGRAADQAALPCE